MRDLEPIQTESFEHRKALLLFLPAAGFAVSFSYAFIFGLYFDYPLAALVISIHAVLYLVTFLFVHFDKIFAGKHFLTVNFLVEVTLHTFYLFGMDYFFHLYFLVGMPLIYSLFSKEQQVARIFYSVVSVGLLIIAVFFSENLVQAYVLPDSKIETMQHLNTMSSFLVLSIAIFLFTNLMEKAEYVANEKSVTDFLTGLPNRRFFISQVNKKLAVSKQQGSVFSLALVDLDYFKQINDHHGHDIGDQVLRSVAELLRDHIRGEDILARFGGEEFVVFFENTTAEHAMAKAEVLRLAILSAPMPKHIKLTASFGVTEVSPQDEELKEIMKRADDALYQAKDAGRNCIEFMGTQVSPAQPDNISVMKAK